MTSSEYKNTIQWTLAAQTPADEDTLITARRIFRNLGVAFPQGTISEVITVIDCGDYMGWNACNAEQARYCANNGYTAIGITQERLVIILPDSNEVRVRSAAPEVTHPVASEISKMSDEEISTMQFFVNAALLQKEESIQADTADIMVVSSANTTYDECESCQFCDTCQTMCQLSCQVCDSCQSTCETSCQSTCQIECQTCDTCQSLCQINCETCDTCQSLCQIVCQTCDTCQSVSEESNQVSVILIEPEADRTEVLTEDHTIFINAVGTNCSSIMAYVNNSLIRMEQGNSLTCLYSVNSAGTYSIYIKGIGSTGLSAYSSTNTVTVLDASHPSVNTTYKIAAMGGEVTGNEQSVKYLSILSSVSDNCNVSIHDTASSNLWQIIDAGGGRLKILTCSNTAFGLNYYYSNGLGNPGNCDVYPHLNNPDSIVEFLSDNQNTQGIIGRIKLIRDDTNLYLTADSTLNGANVSWQPYADSDAQMWKFIESENTESSLRKTIDLPTDRTYNWNQFYSEIKAITGDVGCSWVCGLDIANIYGPSNYLPADMSNAWGSGGYTWGLPSGCTGRILDFDVKLNGSETDEMLEKVLREEPELLADIRYEINNNRPVIIELYNKETSTHYVVAYKYENEGISKSDIIVLDPATQKTNTSQKIGNDWTLPEAESHSYNKTMRRLKFTSGR